MSESNVEKAEIVRVAEAIYDVLPCTMRQAREAAEEADRRGLLMLDGATEEWSFGQVVEETPGGFWAPALRRWVTPWEEVTDG